MVEELKLAIKVDDDAIEQALLKQFANAEKMANKVVLTFNNIDLDDKAIEAKFKEMQKMAGKNPIDLSIDKSSIDMLSAISKQLGNIFDIAKGKSIIDSSASITAIKEESKALEQVSTSAKEASESKEKFAKANKNVKASADSSKASISEEEKYFNSLGNAIKKYDNTLTSISRKPADGNRSKDLQDRIDIISSSLVELRALESNASKDGYIFNEEDINRGKQLEQTIKNNIEAVKQMSSAQKGSDALSRGKEIDAITKYLNKFTGISKQAKQELNGLLKQLQSGDPSVNVKKIHERFLELTVAEREAGRETRNLFDIFKDKKIYSFLGQAASMFSFYDLVNVGREIVTNIKEVDTALTELRKVSDATEQRLTTNFKNSADTAKELGATISDVISATADWSRMGYNIDQAEELARVSTLYKNVGDGIDIETANNSLISTLQGFQLDTSEAESIIDKFNEVANNYAIDSAGIGEALQRSAASFNAANTDLSKSIALITATRLKKLVEYMETYIKNIFNCHRSLYYYTPQYRGNYYMMV